MLTVSVPPYISFRMTELIRTVVVSRAENTTIKYPWNLMLEHRLISLRTAIGASAGRILSGPFFHAAQHPHLLLASKDLIAYSGGGSGGGGSTSGGSTSGAIGGPLTMAGLAEPRFPPAIAVQRLAPQVQRQLRETQELIKDSCAQLYGSGYTSTVGSPSVATGAVAGVGVVGSSTAGGPPGPLRSGPGSVLARASARRPTLETQYSQELS
uniref:Uncharacterized protein n=1 Tax=Anopheles atroparvus TaxID=41427 RepID=A0A182JKL4_ANOAO